MKKVLHFITYNKGIILFFIAMILFTILWVNQVEKTNKQVTEAKNSKYEVKVVG